MILGNRPGLSGRSNGFGWGMLSFGARLFGLPRRRLLCFEGASRLLFGAGSFGGSHRLFRTGRARRVLVDFKLARDHLLRLTKAVMSGAGRDQIALVVGAAQFGLKYGGGLRAVVAVFFQRAKNDAADAFGHVGRKVRQGRRHSFQVLAAHLGSRAPDEGRASREQLVERAAKRVDVRAPVKAAYA